MEMQFSVHIHEKGQGFVFTLDQHGLVSVDCEPTFHAPGCRQTLLRMGSPCLVPTVSTPPSLSRRRTRIGQ